MTGMHVRIAFLLEEMAGSDKKTTSMMWPLQNFLLHNGTIT